MVTAREAKDRPMWPASAPLSIRRAAGFSLLELLVTLSVAGIVLGLAAPSFNGLLLDSQRTVAVNSFVHSIFLARSTASTQGHTVSICRSTDGNNCSNSTANWQQGWIVFVNMDRDEPPIRDASERILFVQAPWRSGTVTSNRRSYSFRPYQHAVVNGTLVFCDRRGPTQARAIIINIAGRPRVATRDSDNRPLRCPNG
jgi:type IV fimbrial biogenesis protein FimT